MNKTETVRFWKKFATMIDNGVPLVATLSTLELEHKNSPFGDVLQEIITDLKDGNRFSQALEKHPSFFGKDVVQMAKGGESQGRLHEVAMVIGQRMDEDLLSTPTSGEIRKDTHSGKQTKPTLSINEVFLAAIREDASDIHFECFTGGKGNREGLIRFRIDGTLREFSTIDHDAYLQMIGRLKTLAALDATEDRIPQDGMIVIETDGECIDLEVAVGPTSLGPAGCVRVVKRNQLQEALKHRELIFPDEPLATEIMDAAKSSHGIIIASGPTGSGKTTTAYSLLTLHDAGSKKIMTVEGPGMLQIQGVHQVEVRPGLGLTYAATLRHFLRMDPDIIFCSEIHDSDTADMLTSIALSGHLVFSQIASTSAVAAIKRLLDLGVEPYFLADALVGVVNQKLVRKLCPYCRKESAEHLERLRELARDLSGTDIPADAVVYESIGCEKCSGTGFKGRRPIMEFLRIDDSLQQILRRKSTREEIDEALEMYDYTTLMENAIPVVLNGETTVIELLKP